MPKQRQTVHINKYLSKENPDSLECEDFGGSLPESTDNFYSGKSLSSETSQLNFKISSSSSDSEEVKRNNKKIIINMIIITHYS